MKGCPTAPEHYRAPPSYRPDRPPAFSSGAARHPVALCPAYASFEELRPPALAPSTSPHRRRCYRGRTCRP
eukprot:scaffold13116_cov62-Phaeocystis_antarctica.AAC.9